MTDVEIAAKFAEHENRIKVCEHREQDLEDKQEKIQELTISVKELALSVKTMAETQVDQGKRIKTLEDVPANNWKDVMKTVVTVIASTIVGVLLKTFL